MPLLRLIWRCSSLFFSTHQGWWGGPAPSFLLDLHHCSLLFSLLWPLYSLQDVVFKAISDTVSSSKQKIYHVIYFTCSWILIVCHTCYWVWQLCRIWSCTLQNLKILSGKNYSKSRIISDLLLAAFVLEYRTNSLLGSLHRRLPNLKHLRLNQFLIRPSNHCRRHCRQMSHVLIGALKLLESSNRREQPLKIILTYIKQRPTNKRSSPSRYRTKQWCHGKFFDRNTSMSLIFGNKASTNKNSNGGIIRSLPAPSF